VTETFEHPTILEVTLVDPIAVLLEELLKIPPKKPSEQDPTAKEVGLATGLCLLLIVFLEAAVMRYRYEHGDTSGKKSVFKYLLGKEPSEPLALWIREVFVLRDVIAHNHLWELTARSDIMSYGKVVAASLSELSGDRKYRQAVDSGKDVTRSLELHVIPTRVDRTDVLKVFNVVWDTLHFLRAPHDEFVARVAMLNIMYARELMTLGDFRKFINSAI
jgi:hypothetical protein